jgi:exodeoxyribonuclease VII small subunit
MQDLSFEDAYARLETTVEQLQAGELSLEQALASYQEGVKLAQYCHDLLQKAELTVQQLRVDTVGNFTVEPLEL